MYIYIWKLQLATPHLSAMTSCFKNSRTCLNITNSSSRSQTTTLVRACIRIAISLTINMNNFTLQLELNNLPIWFIKLHPQDNPFLLPPTLFTNQLESSQLVISNAFPMRIPIKTFYFKFFNMCLYVARPIFLLSYQNQSYTSQKKVQTIKLNRQDNYMLIT